MGTNVWKKRLGGTSANLLLSVLNSLEMSTLRTPAQPVSKLNALMNRSVTLSTTYLSVYLVYQAAARLITVVLESAWRTVLTTHVSLTTSSMERHVRTWTNVRSYLAVTANAATVLAPTVVFAKTGTTKIREHVKMLMSVLITPAPIQRDAPTSKEATFATVWTHSSVILSPKPVSVLTVLKLLRENVLMLMNVQENRLVEKMR